MGNLSTQVGRNNKIEWHSNKVLELTSQGHNQSEVSRILQIAVSTINRDVIYLRRQAKTNIKKYIEERLPEEYEKCMVGLTSILREAWNTAANAQDMREKIQALSLAKECYSMKLKNPKNHNAVIINKDSNKEEFQMIHGLGENNSSKPT